MARKLKEVVDALVSESVPVERVFLSTGSTLLNLGISDRIDGGFEPGNYYYFVGDSSSGKSVFCMTMFAEAAKNLAFDGYRLLFADAERGVKMDLCRFFGAKMANRLEKKHFDENYLEDFYFWITEQLRNGPCIAVLDSMDALIPKDDAEKFDKQKSAFNAGKRESGSFGTAKARINSSNIRIVRSLLSLHGSIFVLISQTRDNIGFASTFDPKTRAGGNALTFFADCEMWTSKVGNMKVNVNDKPREQGIFAKIKIKKGRISGKERVVVVPIAHSVGIDDVGSCVDYLVDEGIWETSAKKTEGPAKRAEGVIVASSLGLRGRREKLVEEIEQAGREGELRAIVQETWDDIERRAALKRKVRYE